MQFIKTLFWVILAVVIVVFAANNWSPVSVLIWDEVRVDTKLPMLVIGAFLLGFLPLFLIHRTSKWRLTRRIKSLEQAARPTPTPVRAPLDLGKEQISEPDAAVTAVSTDPVGNDKVTGQ